MKTIVISAVNLVNGGPLTILNQCLSYLNDIFHIYEENYFIVALVNDKSKCYFQNINYIEYKYPKKNYLFRMFFEYIHSYFISINLKPYLWLSLHDMTPNVISKRRIVYCHNPIIFQVIKIKNLTSLKNYIFNKLYKYIYAININYNDYIIVQQNWIRDKFIEYFKLAKDRIIVAYPISHKLNKSIINSNKILNLDHPILFFYPSFPRGFKNFEVICKAVNILEQQFLNNFNVIITLNGTENSYSKDLYNKFSFLKSIKFTGILSLNEVINNYELCDCLIFPSKLETWGLPISEFSSYNKPMIISDLPYAHETSSNSKYVHFFAPDNPDELAFAMREVIKGNLNIFSSVKPIDIADPFVNSWKGLFDIIL
jgi:glycosyltransferase involved in cell wall biosynthesis